MSSYLVAFIVSDFGNVTNTDNPKLIQRVFTAKKNLDQTAYALDEGVKILDAIAKYLDVPYSLTKMDQAAIPNFRAGGLN